MARMCAIDLLSIDSENRKKKKLQKINKKPKKKEKWHWPIRSDGCIMNMMHFCGIPATLRIEEGWNLCHKVKFQRMRWDEGSTWMSPFVSKTERQEVDMMIRTSHEMCPMKILWFEPASTMLKLLTEINSDHVLQTRRILSSFCKQDELQSMNDICPELFDHYLIWWLSKTQRNQTRSKVSRKLTTPMATNCWWSCLIWII